MLRVGLFEPTFNDELAAHYGPLRSLPQGSEGAEFLSHRGAQFRAIVTAGQPGVDAHTIAALPNLGAIVHIGAGTNSTDLRAAAHRGIGVSNTPDVLSDNVADTAVGLMLKTLRRLADAGSDAIADEPNVPESLAKSDNVVLFPHIGSATARTRIAMVRLAIRNLDRYLATGKLLTPLLEPRPK